VDYRDALNAVQQPQASKLGGTLWPPAAGDLVTQAEQIIRRRRASSI
jgi:hypothetical protein